MRKLMKRALAGMGLQVSRTAETVVFPRPKPGTGLFSCPGIDWNEAASERFLAGPLREHALEPIPGYDPDNPFFGLVDAAVCYAFLRERRPPLVVEVGSGNSSRVIRAALDRNGEGRLVCIDPEPRRDLSGVCHEHRRVPVQEVPLEQLRSVPGDAVLFIDSSHRAGVGSDVNFLFLEVVPALAPGVVVHVHDIYLPEDYPQEWNVDRGFLYTEQYLLQALLCHSAAFEVLWPGRRMIRERSAELAACLGPAADLERHCSFWFRRV
ncbi:MAG TPA: class I SAM-dependent methyltransferase [Thermoanaerobaculia bacterium]|nr:class I SAM-dependent methyltransferase [Thermoanaerobaculia bacterium]